ncbi:hypothetical protein U8C35_28495 (plasmid) [Sinorhizobium medicae]|uniref:Capsule synthesis protein n=1 Tax=Rhizobium meliloti TaxID=382 RepID=I2E207_RHIML|nr:MULTISPECIES: hypothetical protein [Sinorhizobium]AFJ91525.1 capsule synthesis protein [Sinorhizobium meliloti]WQO62313.1 hypothetical protein U8C35_28495 [Sinorhizobium medicae]
MDDLRTPVGADMYAETDPREHTDGVVTLSEMSRGYSTDLGFDDPIFYESVIAKSRFEENQLAEIHLFNLQLIWAPPGGLPIEAFPSPR